MTGFDFESVDFSPLPGDREVLVIPESAGEEWCAMVSEFYAAFRYQTVVTAETYLQPKSPPERRAHAANYAYKFIRGVDGQVASHTLLGIFRGLDFRPDYGSAVGGPLQKIPFARLAPAEDIVMQKPLASDVLHPILVPLAPGTRLIFDRVA